MANLLLWFRAHIRRHPLKFFTSSSTAFFESLSTPPGNRRLVNHPREPQQLLLRCASDTSTLFTSPCIFLPSVCLHCGSISSTSQLWSSSMTLRSITPSHASDNSSNGEERTSTTRTEIHIHTQHTRALSLILTSLYAPKTRNATLKRRTALNSLQREANERPLSSPYVHPFGSWLNSVHAIQFYSIPHAFLFPLFYASVRLACVQANVCVRVVPSLCENLSVLLENSAFISQSSFQRQLVYGERMLREITSFSKRLITNTTYMRLSLLMHHKYMSQLITTMAER